MKSKNFPAKKLRRQLLAKMRAGDITAFTCLEDFERQLAEARKIRTKKVRG